MAFTKGGGAALESSREHTPGPRQNDGSQAVKNLLSQSNHPYTHLLSGPKEMRFGRWESIRPRADYNLSLLFLLHPPPPATKKPKNSYKSRPSLHHARVGGEESDPSHYMSGELDESFSYVYREGDSREPHLPAVASGPASRIPESVHPYYPPVFNLDPVLPYKSQEKMSPELRIDLARIVAMQLKPELLVEQIVIENRLRTMTPADVQRHLNLEGVGVDPRSIRELDRGMLLTVKSKSTPALDSHIHKANNHRKVKRVRPRQRPPLEWCSFNSDVHPPHYNSIMQSSSVGNVNHYEMEGEGDESLFGLNLGVTNFRLPRITPHKQIPHPHPHSSPGGHSETAKNSYPFPIPLPPPPPPALKTASPVNTTEKQKGPVHIIVPSLHPAGGGVRMEPEEMWPKVKYSKTLRPFKH